MVKVVVAGIYSTIYTDPVASDCLQKEVIINGVPGKRIRLDELSLNLQVTKSGILGTVWVTANGEEVARWTETNTKYQPKNSALNAISADGESVTLRWYLTTSNKSYRSRMANLTYSYSIIPASPPVVGVPDSQAVVWVSGITKTQAEELVSELRTDYKDIEVYIKMDR
mgnify:FL=1|jgi:hypothetical protein